ncbi:MAG TPA: type II toxin-antitoxin system VapB family antitoxin [Xanthomonadales bacterium]|nr:type II toxin-antitoxin system VapB family antitoxin [Xanthomonadales bacterium]
MRTTLNIDEELITTAQRLTGLNSKAEIVRAGLQALIERESARRLARLGASQPELQPVARRRAPKS